MSLTTKRASVLACTHAATSERGDLCQWETPQGQPFAICRECCTYCNPRTRPS